MNGLPPPALGLVSDRRRLCHALALPLAAAVDALLAQIAAAAAAGVAWYQLREPDLDAADLLALARGARDTAGPGLPIFVNDRVDVAVAAGVHVHLKSRSLPAARVRPWLPGRTRISRAVHVADEAREAGPTDLLIAGTYAATASKGPDAPLLGADGLAALVAASAVPVYAIGGVTPEAWPAIAGAGASGCAGIGLFLPRTGESIEAAVRRAVADFHGGV